MLGGFGFGLGHGDSGGCGENSNAGSGAASAASSSLASSQVKNDLLDLLMDPEAQVVSTFELNRLATYTYHVDSLIGSGEDDLLETMIETLGQVLARPSLHTTLAVLKSLAVLEWLLLYGSDRVFQETKPLGRSVESLQQNYNTVILAQQSSGLTALALRIKGGGVDRGGPVRTKAGQIIRLWTEPDYYRERRSKCVDSTGESLVPVGSMSKAGFVTDEVRLQALRRRMELETSQRVKSNLQKPEGGFGSGYNSKDGKSVVGAAHGIEEMLKQAEREAKKFQDESRPGRRIPPVMDDHGNLLPAFATATPSSAASEFSEYRAPNLLDATSSAPSGARALALASPPRGQVEADLLDFGPHQASSAVAVGPAPPPAPSLSFEDNGEQDLLGMVASSASESGSSLTHSQRVGHNDPNQPSSNLLDLVPSSSSDWIMGTTSHMGNGTGTASSSLATTTSSMSTAVASNNNHWLGASGGGPAAAVARPNNSLSTAAFSSPSPSVTGAGEPSSSLDATFGSMSLLSSSAFHTIGRVGSDGRAISDGSAVDRFAGLDALVDGQHPQQWHQPPPSSSRGVAGGGGRLSVANSSAAVGTFATDLSSSGYAPWNHRSHQQPQQTSPSSFPSSSYSSTTSPSLVAATNQLGAPAWSTAGVHGGSKLGGDGGGASQGDDAGGGAFVMGGSAGTGLFPTRPAPPSAPPPPPPPSSSSFSFF
jgi:hypothetical protein